MAWGHGGDGFGYSAVCLYLADDGVSIGIMENTDDGEAMPRILTDFLSIITGHLEGTQ